MDGNAIRVDREIRKHSRPGKVKEFRRHLSLRHPSKLFPISFPCFYWNSHPLLLLSCISFSRRSFPFLFDSPFAPHILHSTLADSRRLLENRTSSLWFPQSKYLKCATIIPLLLINWTILQSLNLLLSSLLAFKNDGQKLQKSLQDYASTRSSYIEEFWDDAYLQASDSVVLNLNPFFILEDDPTPSRGNQLMRTANLILASLAFVHDLRTGVLEPDTVRGSE